jgi:arylsulfatase A-like enzyme
VTKIPRAHPRRLLLIALAMSTFSGCSRPPRSVDLLEVAPHALVEATVAGRTRDWVIEQAGRQQPLRDIARATLPAGPPGRLVYRVDVPAGARLKFACGIARERHSAPGVEFSVKVRGDEGQDVLWTRLLNPLAEPAHRGWVTADVDLAAHEGRRVEIAFETTGYEETGDPAGAFWATPALIVPDGAETPLVIVYLVDCLRADHTTPYGYSRNTTPRLEAFAADAVLFEQAIASSGWTKPSVASLFTSLLPDRHGVMQLPDPLDGDLVTLAEMLKAHGYSTGAVVANATLYARGSGFHQGFDVFAGVRGAEGRRSKIVDAARVVDRSLAILDARRGLPTFLYVHTMDAHVPYVPPEPFDRLYGPPPTPDRPASDPRRHYQVPEDLERVVAQYDGCIAYGDREFGRFLSELEARGLYDRALVLFTADHGEEFLDHGRWTHTKSVFDELVHVPLVVKYPGQRDAGRRVSAQVQLVDVLPTILEHEGLPVPTAPAVVGRSLEAIAGPAGERPAIVQNNHRGYVAYGARTAKDKYIRRLGPEDDELYFLLPTDPGEEENRLAEAPDRVQVLKAQVESAMVPNRFDFVLRLEGEGRYELVLTSGGWVERLETSGLGSDDEVTVSEDRHQLDLRVEPRPGQPREVVFGLRPRGAPVWVDGTLDGRPLPLSAVRMAGVGLSPEARPFRLPDIERPDLGTDTERRLRDVFTAPPSGSGLSVWLRLAPAGRVMSFDAETRRQLEALGYIDN